MNMSEQATNHRSTVPAETIKAARSRFYPGWWTLSAVPRPDERLPHYRVVCSDEAERRLALAAKPEHVAVELVMREA
jgi:hypothetical protein